MTWQVKYLIMPVDSRIVETVYCRGMVYLNVVLKDGTPKTIRQHGIRRNG